MYATTGSTPAPIITQSCYVLDREDELASRQLNRVNPDTMRVTTEITNTKGNLTRLGEAHLEDPGRTADHRAGQVPLIESYRIARDRLMSSSRAKTSTPIWL